MLQKLFVFATSSGFVAVGDALDGPEDGVATVSSLLWNRWKMLFVFGVDRTAPVVDDKEALDAIGPRVSFDRLANCSRRLVEKTLGAGDVTSLGLEPIADVKAFTATSGSSSGRLGILY